MEFFIHPPSPYLRQNHPNLLPGWSVPVRSVLLLLQRSPFPLVERSPACEQAKQQLRQQFVQVGHKIAHHLEPLGYQAELFDPKTGFPLLSPPGQKQLDDVALAQSTLDYEVCHTGGCHLLIHPVWGNAVYPSTLVSSAPPEVLQGVVKEISHDRFSES
jgi:hypothetical protein